MRTGRSSTKFSGTRVKKSIEFINELESLKHDVI